MNEKNEDEVPVRRTPLLRRLVRTILAPVRPLFRFARHLPDRLRHRKRRQLAIERIRAATPVESVLVICLGNVCRSPYAERVLLRSLAKHPATGSVRVRSAGFVGGWDRSSPPDAVAVAAGRGVELDRHRSQVMNHSLVDSTDLFVVTDRRQARNLEREFGLDPSRIVHLGDLDPGPIRTRTIEDPWGKGPESFHRSYARIDRCVDHLVSILHMQQEGR